MLRLLPLVFVRPGEQRQAEWAEIDFEASEWRIPARRMKARAARLSPEHEAQTEPERAARGAPIFPRVQVRPMRAIERAQVVVVAADQVGRRCRQLQVLASQRGRSIA